MGKVLSRSMSTHRTAFEVASEAEFYGKEFDLHTSRRGKECVKNPGHEHFIPINEFTKDHLPKDCKRRDEYFQLLMLIAERVVYISTSTVSNSRPKNNEFYNASAYRHGTGFVTDLVLCGQSGQGVQVAVDLIEDLLEQYTLSDLKRARSDSLDRSIYDFDNLFEFHSPSIVKHFQNLMVFWIGENLQGSATASTQDGFTTDLVQQIQCCTECHNNRAVDNITDHCAASATTLNDYRKSKGLSVSEFCLAVTRGLGETKILQSFWEEMGPLLDKPCPCRECQKSETPKKTWWMMKVTTAAHVVFDKQEAIGAKVSLFYDSEEPSGRVETYGISGVTLVGETLTTFASLDSYMFFSSLHEHDIGERLLSTITSMQDMHDKKMTFRSYGDSAAIISHPHGCPKQISFGHRERPQEMSRNGTDCYTTPTCPGSSGAPLIMDNCCFHQFIPSHSHQRVDVEDQLNASGGFIHNFLGREAV